MLYHFFDARKAFAPLTFGCFANTNKDVTNMIAKNILIRRVEIEFDNKSPDFYYRLSEARKHPDLDENERVFLTRLEDKFNAETKRLNEE